jgi:GNAT superfamily N-acetyltransferase
LDDRLTCKSSRRAWPSGAILPLWRAAHLQRWPDKIVVSTIPMTDGLSVRVAGIEDFVLLMRLVRDCIEDMRREGIEQWDEIYPNETILRADVEEQTMYLAGREDDSLIGAFVLNEYQNPEYRDVPWTITGLRVAVVHRLMVDPRHQRQGCAGQLMRFAEEQASALGYGAMRLDAFAANPRAQRLYEGLGYRDAGAVVFRKGLFRCFEKRLGLVHETG